MLNKAHNTEFLKLLAKNNTAPNSPNINKQAGKVAIKEFIANKLNAKFEERKLLKLYYPNVNRSGENIYNKTHIFVMNSLLTWIAGGLLQYEVDSLYKNVNNITITEKTKVIECRIFENEFIDNIETISTYLHNFAINCEQEMIWLEYDSVTYSIIEFHKS